MDELPQWDPSQHGYAPIWWLFVDNADAEARCCHHPNADKWGRCPDCGTLLTRAFTPEMLAELRQLYEAGGTLDTQVDD